MAIRLLLILALALASVTFGPPAAAQPGPEAAQSHCAMAKGADHHDRNDSDRDDGPSHAALHVCPGCALIGVHALANAGAAPVALPDLPANPRSLQSFQANPIPPPPRLA